MPDPIEQAVTAFAAAFCIVGVIVICGALYVAWRLL